MYDDIHRKADEMRKKSKLPESETEAVLLAYTRACIANRDLTERNIREIRHRSALTYLSRNWWDEIKDWIIGFFEGDQA